MQKNSSTSTVHHRSRLLLWGPVFAASAALVSTGACSDEPESSAEIAPFTSFGPVMGTGAGSSMTSTGAINPSSPVGAGGSSTVEGGPATGINLAASGNAGGAPASGGSGGMSAVNTPPPPPKPCVDTPYPFDPDWPEANCESWATEANACGEAYFANYCDVTCGRCLPEGATAAPPPIDCSTQGLPNVTGGNGYTTRYWDCCQTHCSQFDGHKCGQDGTTRTGDNNSSCNGGGSFACYDEAPRAVSDCLSYGHIAKANPNCGGCYRIQFTGEGQYNANDVGSRRIKGKQMIVKVTNTGSDVGGNQFDLMIPGGGVGLFNACSRQWNSNDLGAQYGGFLAECTGSFSQKKECVRQECNKIPAGGARDGCLWFVDWFEIADDPKFTSQQVDCPF
jgi:hypothetical protein